MKLSAADGRISQLNGKAKQNNKTGCSVLDSAIRGQLFRCTRLTCFASIRTSGSSEAMKCGTGLSGEELKETVERPETPQPPRPPVVVDHQRLLVIKTDNSSKRKIYFHWFLVPG